MVGVVRGKGRVGRAEVSRASVVLKSDREHAEREAQTHTHTMARACARAHTHTHTHTHHFTKRVSAEAIGLHLLFVSDWISTGVIFSFTNSWEKPNRLAAQQALPGWLGRLWTDYA